MPWTPEKREMAGRMAEFMETVRGKARGVHNGVADVLSRYVRGISWTGTSYGQIARQLVESVVLGKEIIHKSNKLSAMQWDALIAELEKCPDHEPKKRKPNISRLTQEQVDTAIRRNVKF